MSDNGFLQFDQSSQCLRALICYESSIGSAHHLLDDSHPLGAMALGAL